MVHIPGHVPQTGLIGSEQALQGGLEGALSALQQGVDTGRQDLGQFARFGSQANKLQAQFSGAAGPQQQQSAFQGFVSSPGQQFLRDQQEQALTRNAAAVGGLGGGNVRTALQDQAFGRAQTDFGNQFARLGEVANRGFQAQGTRAGLAAQGGQAAGNLAFGTGQALAGGRTRAGEQIAGNLSGTTSALANLLSGAGQASATSSGNLAQLLANIAAGQGGQISGLGGTPGIQQTSGNTQGLGQLAEGAGTLLSFFGS